MSARTLSAALLLAACVVVQLRVSEGFGNPWQAVNTFSPTFQSCKLSADRNSGSCATYTKECTNFWTHEVVTTQLNCPEPLFFSDAKKKCVNPTTFSVRCFNSGLGIDHPW